MAKESTQQKLSRVRPPRVQITYDVEIGDAIETKELPFVLGVLGDYSGQPKVELPKLKERKFVAVDRDNFDDALKAMAPRLALQVENTLKGVDLINDLLWLEVFQFVEIQLNRQLGVVPFEGVFDLQSQTWRHGF